MSNRVRSWIAGAIVAVSTWAAPAEALTFQLIDYNGSVKGTQAELGFKVATDYWSSMLTSNATVRLEIGYNALAPNIIGSTSSTRTGLATSAVYGKLASTGNSALDQIAVSHLSPLTSAGGLQMITNGYTNTSTKSGVSMTSHVFDNDNSNNNMILGVNTSVAKALGFSVDATQRDAQVNFSSNFAFDFDPTDGISAGTMDFIGVAIHEIGHALGFVSGVDTYDYIAGNYPDLNANGMSNLVSTLDLFRYSSDPYDVAPGSGAALDMSIGGSPFFSINGATAFSGDAYFETGQYKGNGRQASHFADSAGCGGQVGIMDPTFCYGQVGEITNDDIAAFDALGWNVSYDVLADTGYTKTTTDIYRQFASAAKVSSAPEPASWGMMIVGFGAIGAMARRRHRAVCAPARCRA